jgi:hypothetical protein
MTTLSHSIESNTNHDKIDTSVTEKTQEPSGIITPPLSPINGSLASSHPTRQSLRISTGQTGLPWLARDADGDTFSSSQNNNSASSNNSAHGPTSPPPKFSAHPRTSSILRFPTHKRKIQKHIYKMNDGLDPVKVLCKRLLCWRSCVKYLVSLTSYEGVLNQS